MQISPCCGKLMVFEIGTAFFIFMSKFGLGFVIYHQITKFDVSKTTMNYE